MRGLGCSRPRTPKRRLSVPEPRPRTDRNARAPSALGVARAAGSRTNRASRAVACVARRVVPLRRCAARVSYFFVNKSALFCQPSTERGGKVTRTAGDSTFGSRNACGFEERRGFLGYKQLVRLAPILIEIERLVCFGFGFGPPRADGKNSGRGNLPNSRRTRRATRLFPD